MKKIIDTNSTGYVLTFNGASMKIEFNGKIIHVGKPSYVGKIWKKNFKNR